MRKLIVISLAFSMWAGAYAQKDKTVLTVAGEQVSVDEFQQVYRKNNNETPEGDLEAIKEYMELYINFKLKVKEAEELGYDTVKAFQDELNGYRKQLAQPYFTDHEMTDSLVKQAYERLKTEVRAAHILIRVSQEASPEDTLKAYKRILSIKKDIENGLPFETAAKQFSEDPSAKMNAGDLGYFTAFQMVYPFEEAAFTTQKGEISAPVRTRFGYHLVKVKDIRDSRGERRVAHILVKSKETDDAEVQEKAKAKIDEIVTKLNQGESFESMAQLYSDDYSSANRGGELPWFGSGRMVPEFEEAAFSLQEKGAISEPFKTSYGWHIVKLLDTRGLENFEEIKKELERKVERDGRGAKSKEAFVANLKKEYGYKLNEKALKDFYGWIDTSFYSKNWSVEKNVPKNEVLFSLNDAKYSGNKRTVTQKDFGVFVEKTPRYRMQKDGVSAKTIVNRLFEEYSVKTILDFEDALLEDKHPDFKALMKEYRDGILLFELMDDQVWSKAVRDSAGLESYYESNKTDFMWPKRARAIVYSANSEEAAKDAYKLAKKREKKDFTIQFIKNEINTDSELTLKVDSALFSSEKENVFSSIPMEEGLTKPQEINEAHVFVDVLEVLPAQPKKLDEARGLITAAYQNYLEKKWMEELRSKYAFTVNEENLNYIK